MPTGEILQSDAIRVCFEFRASYMMDKRQIRNVVLLKGVLYVYRGNFVIRCHSSMFRVLGFIHDGLVPNQECSVTERCFICLQGKFCSQMPLAYVSSFELHTCGLSQIRNVVLLKGVLYVYRGNFVVRCNNGFEPNQVGSVTERCFTCLQVNFGNQMTFKYSESFGSQFRWILTKF